jgi:glutathione S-transferase
MTDTSNEAVGRLADHLSLEQDQEAADMLRALRSALDIAEAEKRAAVDAAYEKAAERLARGNYRSSDSMGIAIIGPATPDDIRALSDTDALAEWKAEAKRNIRDSVLHECLDIAESLGRQFAEATYASDEGRLQNAAKCYAAGEIATAIEECINAAIRQGAPE